MEPDCRVYLSPRGECSSLEDYAEHIITKSVEADDEGRVDPQLTPYWAFGPGSGSRAHGVEIARKE